ncbi:MAG: ATP-binding cassette domain-containing protein [Anaerolineae bacterium]|jgi:ABC-2 type transport system ATP-binding protein|nr:ATP-binding cassette domain-containing protein [Anaerolineae bacterium]
MASPVISVQNVSKSYGSFRAVQDISFEVRPGEIFAMLGPNGAGKSTTMRMILDIIRPDQGQISVLGGQMTDATKDKIGYLPEERGLYRSVKLVEMMTYLGQLKGMKRPDAIQRAHELLRYLELEEHAKKKVSELSKGMQQKIQFAVTVIHRPQLIIVDEPFSGLDPVNTRVLMDLLLSLRKDGTTIVMSTHQMFQVEELCERLLMINRGKVALYGDVDEVRRRYASHAVDVEGMGDWASVPGVESVKATENGRAATLFLKDGTTSNQMLAALSQAPGVTVEKFALAVPRLNDIFIRVVEEGGAAR